jgi:glutamate-1-semialdehyde 2,1-aminomutase
LVNTSIKTTKSQEIFAAAQKLMPGGVSSPVRAFKSVGGQPIVFDRVNGAYIWDIDGNKYIDYVGTWGPAICGHAHPEVISALHTALDKGTSFGAPCVLENILAEMVIDAVPSVEMVRLWPSYASCEPLQIEKKSSNLKAAITDTLICS